jgi:hypothetical protein
MGLATYAVASLALVSIAGVAQEHEQGCSVPEQGHALLAHRFHTMNRNATQEDGSSLPALVGMNATTSSNAATGLSLQPDVPTVIFIAGVEGAGHHFMQKFMNQILGKHVEFPESWRCGKTWASDGIDAMRERMARLQKGQAYMLYDCCPDCQASYPCGGGSHHERNNDHWPRLDWIAEAAGKAGVALRVLFLYRSLEDCLAADCLHRKNEDCDRMAQTLSSVGTVLAGQAMLASAGNPQMISCFRYGDLKSLEVAMQDLFGEGKVSKDLIHSAWKERAPKRMRQSIQNWPDLAASMQSADDNLFSVCSDAGQATFNMLMGLGPHSRNNRHA